MDDSKIPSSTPLTVLSADDPPQRTVGFSVHEYLGSSIFPVGGDPVPSTEDLIPGQEYYSNGLGGVCVGTAVNHNGDFLLDCEGVYGLLRRDEDDRHVWTVICWVNKKAYQVLTGPKV